MGIDVRQYAMANQSFKRAGVRPQDLARVQELGTYEGVNLARDLPRYVTRGNRVRGEPPA